MPVNSTNCSYDAYVDKWQKCRNAVDGEEAVKAEGRLYLPALDGQSTSEYDAYLTRALFYNASQRTVMGLSGFIFRKPPDVKFAEGKFLDIVKNKIGADGQGISAVGQEVVQEVLTTGRIGMLVDSPPNSGNQNPDPYVTLYTAENIINWKTTWINGEKVVVRVVLHETYQEDDDTDIDGFATKECDQYRVLYLDFSDVNNPVYRQSIWREKELTEDEKKESSEAEFEKVEDITPRKHGGKTLIRIPFVFQNPVGASDQIYNPPILDLVNVNLSHFRSSADLEHGRHFTALPTAWATGFDLPPNGLRIGSATAWITKDPGGACGFLEFTGSGLKSLETALTEKERQMAILGARILDENKKEAESADTVAFRHVGEQNTLTIVVGAVSEGLTKVLKLIAMWVNESEDSAAITLNKDFNLSNLDAGMLISLLAAVQQGSLSFDTFFDICKRGEMYPQGWTKEDERKAIEAGSPLPPPGQVITSSNLPKPGGGSGNANTAITANL